MDSNTLKLKLTVCTLTSQSLYHFKSKVLKYSEKQIVTVAILLELTVGRTPSSIFQNKQFLFRWGNSVLDGCQVVYFGLCCFRYILISLCLCCSESVKPLEEFELCLSDVDLMVHGAVGASELPNTAKSGTPNLLTLIAKPCHSR